MKPGQIFSKTLPFVWAKLLLGLATVIISIVILAILMGIALFLFNNPGVAGVMFFIWLFVTVILNFVLNHYMGYLLKAGHIAVITEAVTTGRVPDNQVAYGKQMVTERFATSNIYFVVDRLVSGAVRQIQRTVEKVGNALGGFIPGMSAVMSIAKMFVGIALGYIDECCLGYTFYKKEQSAFKSAADGVVIYAQNWKTLLKDAAKTTAMVIGLVVAVTLVSFLLFGLLFAFVARVLALGDVVGGIAGFVAFLLACFVASAVKKAFIDSFILVKMMTSYMQVAPSTVITFDLYTKLCGWSGKFKALFTKGQQESPTPEPAHATAGTAQPSAPANKDKPVFCSECGAKNTRGVKFCGSCGKPMAK